MPNGINIPPKVLSPLELARIINPSGIKMRGRNAEYGFIMKLKSKFSVN